MNIAGREEEMKIFQRLIDSENSEFLAVYGRRRIGKTYLIRQFFQPQLFFETSGLHEKSMTQQLECFWFSLKEFFPKKEIEKPKTWLQAFSILKNQIISSKKKGKKVINSKILLQISKTKFVFFRDNIVLFIENLPFTQYIDRSHKISFY